MKFRLFDLFIRFLSLSVAAISAGLIFVFLPSPCCLAILAEIDSAGDFVAIHGAREFVREPRAFRTSGSPESHLIAGHSASEIAIVELTVMRTEELRAVLLQHNGVIGGPSPESQAR